MGRQIIFAKMSVHILFLLIGCCYCLVSNDMSTRMKRHIVDKARLCRAFGCINGYCKERELRKYRIVCQCYAGYEGKLCERLTCPYPCGIHGRCVRKGQQLYCECDKGYYGSVCKSSSIQRLGTKKNGLISRSSYNSGIDSPIIMDSGRSAFKLKNKNRWFKHKHAPTGIKFANFHSHAVIDKNVKPDVCAPGFKCYHGHCDRESMFYGIFQCVCKRNYTGLFCEKRCTLHCKNGGSCMVLEDGHQVCNCPFSHTGHYCEIPGHLG